MARISLNQAVGPGGPGSTTLSDQLELFIDADAHPAPPDEALLTRYRAALKLLRDMHDPGERAELLAAVVSPVDPRLRSA